MHVFQPFSSDPAGGRVGARAFREEEEEEEVNAPMSGGAIFDCLFCYPMIFQGTSMPMTYNETASSFHQKHELPEVSAHSFTCRLLSRVDERVPSGSDEN